METSVARTNKLPYFMALIVLFTLVVAAISRPQHAKAVSKNQTRKYTLKSPLGRGRYNAPAWSPDRTHLAFIFRGSGADELWVWETDTGETRKIRTQGHFSPFQRVIWRDDKTIVFLSNNILYGATVGIDSEVLLKEQG